jgi:hypothetical protein
MVGTGSGEGCEVGVWFLNIATRTHPFRWIDNWRKIPSSLHQFSRGYQELIEIMTRSKHLKSRATQ